MTQDGLLIQVDSIEDVSVVGREEMKLTLILGILKP
jgi:hypothetical protein